MQEELRFSQTEIHNALVSIGHTTASTMETLGGELNDTERQMFMNGVVAVLKAARKTFSIADDTFDAI